MPGDPSIDCGDMLAIPIDDVTANSIVTKITWRYRGKMTVDSTGKNPLLYGMKPKKAQVIRQLQSQTTENKLIFYSFTNQAAVTAKDDTPVEIAQVTVVTTKSTSAMFIAQLPIEVVCEDTVVTKSMDTEKTVSVTDSTGATATITDANGNPLTLKVVQTDTDTTITPGYVDIQVEYYLMGTLVDYELIHRARAGRHILSLFYTFASLDANENYQWQVKIKVIGGTGTVTVPKRAFRATITGQGLAGTAAWDGTLTFDEAVTPISLRSNLAMVKAVETVVTETQKPTPADIVEVMPRLSLRSSLSLVGITERFSATEIREKKTIEYAEWEYTDRYVEIDSTGIMARMEWQYKSTEAAVDAGRMTVVKAMTNDLVSVTGVEVDME
jgi:hypothetical protein